MTTVPEALAALADLEDPAVVIGFDPDNVTHGSASGRLAGEAIVVKDCIAVPDHPVTGGCSVLSDYRIPVGTGVQRLLDEGAVIVATSNMHELAFGVTGLNNWMGMPINPAAPERVPGGSSSGTAAAIARGVVDVGIGTDTGGSARIPAACCGVIGFRPSTGRYPNDGLLTLSETRDTIGVLARNLSDISRFDQVLAGEAGTRPAGDVIAKQIAVLDTDGLGRCDDAVAHAYQSWLDRCMNAGIEIAEVDIEPLLEMNDQASFPVALRETILNFQDLARQVGIPYDDFVAALSNDDVRQLVAQEPPTAAMHKHAIESVIPAMVDWYELTLSTSDLLAWPTMPVMPPLRSEHTEMEVHGEVVPTFPTMAAFTSPASLAGAPSLSVPIESDAGPVAIMLEGRPGHDSILLQRAASILERIQ